jgi:hypothetical protein
LNDVHSETTYRFRVQAVNSVGAGELSEPQSVRTDREYTVPYAPE